MDGVLLFTRLAPLNFVTRCAIVARPCFSYAEACNNGTYFFELESRNEKVDFLVSVAKIIYENGKARKNGLFN